MIFGMIGGTIEKITPSRTAKGTPTLRMRVLAEHRYMNKGKMTVTAYHFHVVAWGNVAQMNETLATESYVICRGMYRPRAYDAGTGRKEWIWELVADEIDVVSGGRDGGLFPDAEPAPGADPGDDRPPPEEPLP